MNHHDRSHRQKTGDMNQVKVLAKCFLNVECQLRYMYLGLSCCEKLEAIDNAPHAVSAKQDVHPALLALPCQLMPGLPQLNKL